ncbi:MAG: Glu-tRNA(Gln) amidotransferase subunit GatD [Candidatus Heimdallarchaeaceae archaeon]
MSKAFTNYSEKIKKILLKNDIKPGDKIKITKQNISYEGFILPRFEVGDPNVIQIKLDNGYNIGISYSPETEITALSEGFQLETFPSLEIKQDSKLPNISLIATGGTIASRIDYLTGGVVMAMKPEELLFSIPELNTKVQFSTVKQLFQIGSEEIWIKQWKVLAEQIYKEINSGVEGVVVTHGTDVMHFSSAVMSFMLQNLPIPVVFTGAQRSSDRGSFDGALNLICASNVAAYSNIAEVLVCMHSSINDESCILIHGTRARKMHTSSRDAFQSINATPLGLISKDGKLTLYQNNFRIRNKENNVLLDTKFETKIAIVKAYPGSNPELLDWYVDKGYRGIIIEGTGLGHTPTIPPEGEENRSWTPHIQRAVDSGVFIGITSQCIFGRVHPNVYRALRLNRLAGTTYLEDMITETAFIKLGYILAHYSNLEDIEREMLTNYVGEISRRSFIQM